MITIDYPDYAHKIKKDGKEAIIFDPVRKKWVKLTPEEWVRQNFIQFLLQVMLYPAALLSVEKEIMVGERRRRYDIVMYDRDMKPYLLVECKQTTEAMDQIVLDQVMHYHIKVQVPYIVITNGHYTYAWEKQEGKLHMLDAFPPWVPVSGSSSSEPASGPSPSGSASDSPGE